MKFLLTGLALSMAVCTSAWAQQKAPAAGKDAAAKNPAIDAPLPPSQWNDKPLPEMKGVLSWKTLGEVKPVKQKDKFVPEFAKAVSALDNKEVKIQGFMMPLDMGEKQARFILSALPPSCSFCLPGGPEQMGSASQVAGQMASSLLLTGKLAVLKDDPMDSTTGYGCGIDRREVHLPPITPVEGQQ